MYFHPSYISELIWSSLKNKKNPKTNKTPPLQRNQRHYLACSESCSCTEDLGGTPSRRALPGWVSLCEHRRNGRGTVPRGLSGNKPASCPAFHPHQHWYCCTENTLLLSFSPLGVRCTTCCLTLSNWETNIHRNQLLPFLTAFSRVLMKAGVPLMKGIWLCGRSLRKQRCSKDVHSRLQVSASCMHNARR